jgi:hypothetical protein
VNVVCDTTVLRNFAVLGLHGVLAAVCGGRFICVPDVAVLDGGVLDGELAEIRTAIEVEAGSAQGGSSMQSTLVAALDGIDRLAQSFDDHVDVHHLGADDAVLALRLRSPAERSWRRNQGLSATPLGAGEAASIAVSIRLGCALATDDVPARRAYERLGGNALLWSTDLLQHAVDATLLTLAEASSALAVLRARYRFHAPDVTFSATRPRPPREERGGSR